MESLFVSDDRLFSRKEAARYLVIAPQTLAVWACTGRYNLPYIKIGHRVRYRKSDLNEFIARNLKGGKSSLRSPR